MAAAYLLQELAGCDHRLQITVIGDERDACYNRVLLSGVLAGDTTEDDLPMLARKAALDTPCTSSPAPGLCSVNVQQRTLLTDKGDMPALRHAGICHRCDGGHARHGHE